MTLLPALLILLTSFTSTLTEDPAMRAELGIAEKILQELFNQLDREGGAASATMVRASHIPGYGIMLEASVAVRPRMIRVNRDERTAGFRVDGSTRPNTDSLKLAFTGVAETYLTRYADLIANVPADALISVNITTQGSFGGSSSGDRILVSVRKRDLTDRQAGRITETVLRTRIRKDAVMAAPDLDILAKVIETAVNADTSKMFTAGILRSAVLPGYGAMISGDVRTIGTWRLRGGPGMGPGMPLESLDLRGTALPEGVFELRIDSLIGVDRMVERQARRELDMARQELDRMRIVIGQEAAVRERSEADIRRAYDALETRLKDLLVDYGRTATSLESGQSLMVRIALIRLPEGLPRYLTLTIPRQVLADYDRRTITKSQAVQRIQVSRE